MAKTKLTSKGQVTIPKAVRDQLGLRPGDEIDFVEENGDFRLRKRAVKPLFEKWRGYAKHLAGMDPDELVEQMRGE